MRLNSINNNTENTKVNETKEVQQDTEVAIDDDLPTVEKEKIATQGMDLAEKITYWKDKYKKIYRTVIDDTTFIWRRINRAEYSKCAFEKFSTNSKLDMFEKQYLFCKIGILYPENAIELMDDSAGIAAILSDEIIYKSGFADMYPKTTEVEDADDVITDNEDNLDEDK